MTSTKTFHIGDSELCTLNNGDLITIHWSGHLRTVAVKITPEGVALRDLTEAEMAELQEVYR
jgi:hypothetical protein